MPDVLVLDASALCKLLRDEPQADDVSSQVRDHMQQGGEVWTDSFAALEIVTCARKAVDAGEGSLREVAQAVRHVLGIAHLVVRDNDGEGGLDALVKLAHETGLNGPDARYVELALGNRLLTFDGKQAAAAKKKGIRLA